VPHDLEQPNDPNDLEARIRRVIDQKTKPLGALGRLETLAAQLCRWQGTVEPALRRPEIVVFAADHGLSAEGVSAYPKAVTAQMAANILAGGAGVNVLARQHGITVRLIDAGVDWPGRRPDGMIDQWMGPGTGDALTGEAMTAAQVEGCLAAGAAVVDQVVDPQCNVLGFGELGIGNTSSASLLVAGLTGMPLADCVGPGSGLRGAGLERKLEVLRRVQARRPAPADARQALGWFGGFEIAQMCGAMRRARATRRLLLIDGFVATAAFLAAWSLDSTIIDGAVFCHRSGEPGHRRVLDHLGAEPLLDLGMRLGEGSGCAVAYPLLVSAVDFVDQMASFDQAGVATGEPEAAAGRG
jgi:nicotinate-nucleotide--dimethylbenzimidazole phosphoribosyltransferase